MFDDAAWRATLQDRVRRFRDSASGSETHGRLETEEAYAARVRRELAESKAILERRLDKEVRVLCWPGGGVNEQVLGIAREAGYTRFTLPGKWRYLPPDGRLAGMLPRVGSRDRIRWRGKDLGRPSAREFLWHVEAARGSRFHRFLSRASLAARIGRSYLSLDRPPR